MNKKRLCLIITLTSITLMIVLSVSFKIMDDADSKSEKYLKKNLVSLVEKCIKEENCEKKPITLNELNSKGYLNNEILNELKSYSLDTVVGYPTRDVILIKK